MTVPEHLHINGRTEDQSFTENDHLYRGYTFEEYDFLEDAIKTETVKFPDFSCNWNRYSEPVDVRYRLNGRKTVEKQTLLILSRPKTENSKVRVKSWRIGRT